MNRCKEKLLIIQNIIPHYRKPVYNELSKYYSVTVMHSGRKSQTMKDSYTEIIVPSKRFGPFVFQYGVLNEIQNENYQAVIVMFDIRWIANVFAVFCKRSRFLYWGHRYSRNILTNKIRDVLMKKADGVILYSHGEIKKIVSNGLPRYKIFVANNTLHVKNHYDGSCFNKDSLLFVGRAQKRKKIELLLNVFSEITERIPENIVVNIVGSGVENDNLKIFSERLGIADRVIFHGEIVDPEKLRPIFHRAYAYVSPGPVGLGVLHSFAYGIPVVTCCYGKHGPEYEILSSGYNSIIYQKDEELKAILISLCNDEKISQKLGKNAYNYYSKCSTLENMVNGFVDAIKFSDT